MVWHQQETVGQDTQQREREAGIIVSAWEGNRYVVKEMEATG